MAASDNYGLFWDSVGGDRAYDASSFEKWIKKFFDEGVFEGDLEVTASSGMTVSVSPGYCAIQGKVGIFPTTTSVILAAASSAYPRIDNIVIERNNGNRDITIKAVTGPYSGSTPYPAMPTRTGAVYQIVLAHVYVKAKAAGITAADITDTRRDTSICGIVTGHVEGLSGVARSGDFEDLEDKPSFAKVAYTGKYEDLTNAPALANVATSGKYSDLIGTPTFANVAYTGSYKDLKNTPDIPYPHISSYYEVGDKFIHFTMLDYPEDTYDYEDFPWLVSKGAFANTVSISSVFKLRATKEFAPEPDFVPEAILNVCIFSECGSYKGKKVGDKTVDWEYGNVLIGSDADYSHPPESSSPTENVGIGRSVYIDGGQHVAIGTWASSYGTKGIGLGAGAAGLENTIRLGSVDSSSSAKFPPISSLRCSVPLSTTSDSRDKTDVVPIKNALSFISRLRAVTYVRNHRSLYHKKLLSEDEQIIREKYGVYKYDKASHQKGEKKGKRKRAGMLAQEVLKALKEAYGNSEYADIVREMPMDCKNMPDESETQLTMCYSKFVPFLIEAIKDLSDKVDGLEKIKAGENASKGVVANGGI